MTDHTDLQTSEASAVLDAAVMTRSISAVEKAAGAFDAIGSSVAALAREHPPASLPDMETKDGQKSAQAGYSAWRAKRLELERCRKDVKAPLLQLTRAIDGYAGQLESSLRAGEVHYKKLIDDHAEKVARKERERVESHKANIEKIKGYVVAAKGLPPARLRIGIERLKQMVFGQEWEEFANEAHIVRQQALEAIEAMLEKALEEERLERERAERDAVIAKERVDLERERAELEDLKRSLASTRALKDFLKCHKEMALNAVSEQLPSVCLRSDINRLKIDGIPASITDGGERDLATASLDTIIQTMESAFNAAVQRERETTSGLADSGGPATESRDDAPQARESGPVEPMCVPEDPKPATVADAGSQLVKDVSEKLINLTALSEWLGFSVPAAFIQKTLNIPARKTERKSVLFYESDRSDIATALIQHLVLLRSEL